ncbi:MAG: hypothetical protein OXG72_01595 [Acidobacteria bacterium]|nr:hypothetical protein [Acidobacteriota bacterium]
MLAQLLDRIAGATRYRARQLGPLSPRAGITLDKIEHHGCAVPPLPARGNHPAPPHTSDPLRDPEGQHDGDDTPDVRLQPPGRSRSRNRRRRGSAL